MSAPSFESPARADEDDLGGVMIEQIERLLADLVDRKALEAAEASAWHASMWDALVAAGLPLALVPERLGGIGLTVATAMALVRRTAYHAVPLPIAECMLASALWADAAGAVPRGVVTMAAGTVVADVSGSHVHLSGSARRVAWGARADDILIEVRSTDQQRLLVLVPHGSGRVRERRNLAGEPRDSLDLDGVQVPVDRCRLLPTSCADGLLAWGAMLRAVQMVGAMERCLDHAIDYAGLRVQFGRPIAKFQAVQHMLAQAAGHFAAAAAATDGAVYAAGRPGFEFAAAIAKARAGEAVGPVAEAAHQVHAGIGFTREHPLHFSSRRLWSWRDEFGHEAYWQELIGRRVCAAGGETLWQMLTVESDRPAAATEATQENAD